jgi:hypothetical protein
VKGDEGHERPRPAGLPRPRDAEKVREERARRTIHDMPLPVDTEIAGDAMIARDAYGRAFRAAGRGNDYAIH